jgi:hypothetical protein
VSNIELMTREEALGFVAEILNEVSKTTATTTVNTADSELCQCRALCSDFLELAATTHRALTGLQYTHSSTLTDTFNLSRLDTIRSQACHPHRTAAAIVTTTTTTRDRRRQ